MKTRGELLRGDLGEGIDHLWRATAHGAHGVSAAVRPRLASARIKAAPSAERVRRAAAHGWGAAAASVALLPLMAAVRDRATGANQSAARGAGKVGKLAVKAKTGKPAGRARVRVIGKKGSGSSATRTRLLIGLLAGGATAGVAAALKSRRNRSQWEEHESPGVGGPTGDAWSSVLDTTKSAEDRRVDKVTGSLDISSDKAAEKASTRAGSAKAPASKQSKAAGNASTAAEQPSVTLDFGKDKADQSADRPATVSKDRSGG